MPIPGPLGCACMRACFCVSVCLSRTSNKTNNVASFFVPEGVAVALHETDETPTLQQWTQTSISIVGVAGQRGVGIEEVVHLHNHTSTEMTTPCAPPYAPPYAPLCAPPYAPPDAPTPHAPHYTQVLLNLVMQNKPTSGGQNVGSS